MKHVTRKHIILSLLFSGIALCGVGFGTWKIVERVNADASFSFGADKVLDVSKAVSVNDHRVSGRFHQFEYNENGILVDGRSSNEGDMIVPLLISLNTTMSDDGIYNKSGIESGTPLNFTFSINEVNTNSLLPYCTSLSYFVGKVDSVSGVHHVTKEPDNFVRNGNLVEGNITISDVALLKSAAIGIGLYYHLSFPGGYDFKTNVFDKREDLDFKVRVFLNV